MLYEHDSVQVVVRHLLEYQVGFNLAGLSPDMGLTESDGRIQVGLKPELQVPTQPVVAVEFARKVHDGVRIDDLLGRYTPHWDRLLRLTGWLVTYSSIFTVVLSRLLLGFIQFC